MKRIYVTDDVKQNIRNQLEEILMGKGLPSKLEFITNPSIKVKEDEKLKIFFEWPAWSKMNALVQCCDKEIGFYGLVERDENGKDFRIYDILVCPQTVTGVTVTTDDTEYSNWIESIFDTYGEDAINKRRFYGHSHVRMSCSPSSTDNKQYDDLLQTHDDFYIFGIFNKSGDYWFQVADMERNIYYEKEDIIYVNANSGTEWAKQEIAEKVKEHVYKPAYGTYNGYAKTEKKSGYYSSGKDAWKKYLEDMYD